MTSSCPIEDCASVAKYDKKLWNFWTTWLQERENMFLLTSAGKRATGGKRGKLSRVSQATIGFGFVFD